MTSNNTTYRSETMTTETCQIEIAYNAHEAHEFVAWLNSQGYDAHVGDDTGNYIDGVCTDYTEDDTLTELWNRYCNS